jgi:hypothetical protein
MLAKWGITIVKTTLILMSKVVFVDSLSEVVFIIVNKERTSCRFELLKAEGVENYFKRLLHYFNKCNIQYISF